MLRDSEHDGKIFKNETLFIQGNPHYVINYSTLIRKALHYSAAHKAGL